MRLILKSGIFHEEHIYITINLTNNEADQSNGEEERPYILLRIGQCTEVKDDRGNHHDDFNLL